MTVRQGIEEYIHSKYNGTVEYLWKRFPDYGIVRHQDNQKWYGLFMDLPRNKMASLEKETSKYSISS